MEKSAASGGGPDEESRYHYLSFGWLLGGLLEKIDGRPFAEMVRDEIARPLGLVDQLVIGVDPACVERCFTDSGGGLAVITSSLDKAQLRAQRPAAAEGGVTGAESSAGANQPAGGALESDMLMLMSPTLFNHPKFRTGVIPSANGHCSARGLATFFGSILCGPGDDESRIGFTAKTAKIMREGEDAFAVEDTAKFGYGFQRFDMGDTASAFGHAGVGGSLAFCDPASGTSVAITLNKLSLHCEPTKLLLDEICDELPELRTFSGYS
jgi:aarF domain-containing kinase